MWLVNARDVKHLPGRGKSDKADCVWLCKLNERGMLRRSFVPAQAVRDLRALTRTRARLAQDQARHQSRVEKILEDALLTELPDVAAAQDAQLFPRPIVGVSERSRSPGNGGHAASLIVTETGHTVLNHLPSFSSLPIFDVSRSRPRALVQPP